LHRGKEIRSLARHAKVEYASESAVKGKKEKEETRNTFCGSLSGIYCVEQTVIKRDVGYSLPIFHSTIYSTCWTRNKKESTPRRIAVRCELWRDILFSQAPIKLMAPKIGNELYTNLEISAAA